MWLTASLLIVSVFSLEEHARNILDKSSGETIEITIDPTTWFEAIETCIKLGGVLQDASIPGNDPRTVCVVRSTTPVWTGNYLNYNPVRDPADIQAFINSRHPDEESMYRCGYIKLSPGKLPDIQVIHAGDCRDRRPALVTVGFTIAPYSNLTWVDACISSSPFWKPDSDLPISDYQAQFIPKNEELWVYILLLSEWKYGSRDEVPVSEITECGVVNCASNATTRPLTAVKCTEKRASVCRAPASGVSTDLPTTDRNGYANVTDGKGDACIYAGGIVSGFVLVAGIIVRIFCWTRRVKKPQDGHEQLTEHEQPTDRREIPSINHTSVQPESTDTSNENTYPKTVVESVV